jgi:hypothetical protein
MFFLCSCKKQAYYMPEIHANVFIYAVDTLMTYSSSYKIKYLSWIIEKFKANQKNYNNNIAHMCDSVWSLNPSWTQYSFLTLS